MLPYLLINSRLLSMTAVSALVFWYMKFQWAVPTVVWAIFYIICVAAGIIKWSRVSYCITSAGPCVKIGPKYHQMYWEDLDQKDCRVIKSPLHLMFGCRTVQFAIQYGYTSNRGTNTNLLRESARFWCIREYEKVEGTIRRHMG